jgi:hypothetical protein
MRQDLDDRLVREFPNLYRDRNGTEDVTRMCDGFPGDGWFDLLYEASQKIEAAILALPESERPKYKACQVKEKFGTLRFYMDGPSTPEMDAAIRVAEDKSCKTCEYCGAPGKATRGGWVKTLCSDCNKK